MHFETAMTKSQQLLYKSWTIRFSRMHLQRTRLYGTENGIYDRSWGVALHGKLILIPCVLNGTHDDPTTAPKAINRSFAHDLALAH